MDIFTDGAELEPTNSADSSPCSCSGEGIVISTADRIITAEICNRCIVDWNTKKTRDAYAKTISFGQIPCGFLAARNADSIPPLVEDWYKEQVTLPKKELSSSVFLCGPSGAGKSFAAIALLFRFAKMGLTVRYIDCSEYLMDRRASYSTKHIGNIGDAFAKKTEADRLALGRYDVVILDNIGVGTSNDWTKEQYDHLIDSRQSSGKTTIFISNYSDDPEHTVDNKKLSSLIGARATKRINLATTLFLSERTQEISRPASTVFEPVKPPRPLSPNETTFLHIWAREGLFSMVSKKERSTLTSKSKINSNEVIELPFAKPREYISWSGFHITLQGPVVDYDDANVLAALMKIYHRSGSAGTVITSLAQILRELGLESDSGAKLKQLKRSLVRLAESRITIRTVPTDPKVKSEATMWIGGFLENVMYEGSTKNRKVIIKFNEAMAPFYQKKSLVLLPLDTLTSLSPYAQGIYRFLLGHRDDYKFISLPRWREILAINPSVQDKCFRNSIRLALKELISRRLLTQESCIDPNGIVHSYVNRSHCEQIH